VGPTPRPSSRRFTTWHMQHPLVPNTTTALAPAMRATRSYTAMELEPGGGDDDPVVLLAAMRIIFFSGVLFFLFFSGIDVLVCERGTERVLASL
jgi:hypothetical protein